MSICCSWSGDGRIHSVPDASEQITCCTKDPEAGQRFPAISIQKSC